MTRKNELHTYVVRGTAPFPHDMLRYDQSWPVDGGELDRICGTFDQGTVTLQYRGNEATYSGLRWESFGWRIVV